MTDWKFAMLLILPLMWGRGKLRTWAALLGNALVAMMMPPMAVHAYIVLDAVCGGLVLVRPAGCAQRGVGALFAVMVLFHVGYLLSGNPGVTEFYWLFNVVAGWLQWAILAWWGLYDAARYVVRHHRGRSRPVAIGEGA